MAWLKPFSRSGVLKRIQAMPGIAQLHLETVALACLHHACCLLLAGWVRTRAPAAESLHDHHIACGKMYAVSRRGSGSVN